MNFIISPGRGMEYYSPTLSTQELEKLREPFTKIVTKYQSEGKNLLDAAIAIIKNYASPDSKPAKITLKPQAFIDHDILLKDFMSRYLDSNLVIEPGDPVMHLSRYWSDFLLTLDMRYRSEFFTVTHPTPLDSK